MQETNSEIRLAQILCETRNKKGMSQEQLAMELGVARKTIQNWEKGVSAPNINQAVEWFRVLGASPIPYLLKYIFPDMENISAKDSDDKLRASLVNIIDTLPMEGVRRLLYLFYGDHGSSPRAIIQLMNAHLQTPMKDRLTQARVITNNYELARKKGNLTSKEHVQPDISLLETAIDQGEKAVLEDRESYTIS